MQVLFHKSFKKQYKKLPPKVRANFDQRLALLLANPADPLLRLHKLSGNRVPLESFNVTADYRALILRTKSAIVCMEIGTHSELYG